jgi:hypothetical protein
LCKIVKKEKSATILVLSGQDICICDFVGHSNGNNEKSLFRFCRLEVIETEFIHFNDLVPEYSSVHKEAEGVPETRITVNHEHFSRKESG